MTTVTTITIPLDQPAVDWLRAARDTLAPDMADGDLLAWLAARGHELLHADICGLLARRDALAAHAAQLAAQADRDTSAPPPAPDLGESTP